MTIDELMKEEIALRRAKMSTMREYLLLKFNEDDYHGVQDAASDLRDMESEIAGLKTAADILGVIR